MNILLPTQEVVSMKGDPRTIEYLNKGLKVELAAINQYYLHSKIFENWGLSKLAKKEYDESIDEMRHADTFIERILFLEGEPNLREPTKLIIGKNVKECLKGDLELEQRARSFYIEASDYCDETKDYGSRDLFELILRSEEEHIDWLETQLDLIERIGEQNYQQSMV
jgi:bacterioferritin